MTRTASGDSGRGVRVAGALAVCLALLLALVGPRQLADAQTDDAADERASPRVRLTLSHLTTSLGPGSIPVGDDAEVIPPDELELRALIAHDGPDTLDALRLAVEIHPAVRDAAALQAAFTGDLATQPIHVHSPEIAAGRALAPDEVVGVATEFPAGDVDWASDPGGVHPIRVAVLRGTEVLAETVTATIWLAAPPEQPLLTTLVWPIDDAPWRTTGGAYPAEVDHDLRRGGRLDVLLAALEGRPGAPVVLAPAAHLLEDLRDRTDGYTRMERQDDGALESHTVAAEGAGALMSAAMLGRLRRLADELPLAPVSSSYADADLAALLAGGPALRNLGATAAVDGRRRLGLALGVEADAATHLIGDRIDVGVLDVLPGDALLVPARITDVGEPDGGGDGDVPEPVRRLRTPSGRLVTGLVADPYVEQALGHIRDPAGGVVAAQRILAHTAMRYLAAPATADRALLILPPRTFSPGPQAAAALLTGLTGAPWLRLATPTRLARDARTSGTALEFEPGAGPRFPPEFVTALTTAHADLTAAVHAAPEGTARLGDRPISDLQDALLRSTSRWYRGAGSADALVRDVQQVVDTSFGDIEVASGSVTLTSDTGQIPITLQRSHGGPLRVRVALESQGRLEWPEGRTIDEVVLEEGGSQTVTFSTRALSTGTFPVTVRVTDPSGAHEFVRTSLSVRSTAISRPALAGIGAVVLLLLLLGGLRRRRPDPLRVVPQR